MAELETTGQQFHRTAQVLDGVYQESSQALAVTSRSGIASIWTLPFDRVIVAYPNSATEVYSSYNGASLQQVVTVTYTAADKLSLSSVVRS